jgi:DNA-binding transcriptional MerR regulator
MTSYSIKNLEQISGIKAHTLRIWEQRYDFIRPSRTETNIRYYTEDDLKLILNVTFLKDHGYKINEINKMANGELQQKVANLIEQQYGYLEQMHALTMAMIELSEGKFEKVLKDYTFRIGFEQTMIQLIFPFFEKTSILWQTGSINSVQRQFISNLIRQKLIALLDDVNVATNGDSRTYVLLAPPEEHSEIGLLFSNLVLKRRKQRVIYLGLDIPARDLPMISIAFKPDYLLLASASPIPLNKLTNYFEALVDTCPDARLIIAIRNNNFQKKNLPKNSILIRSASEFITFIELEKK